LMVTRRIPPLFAATELLLSMLFAGANMSASWSILSVDAFGDPHT